MFSVDWCILNKDTRLVQPERLVDTTMTTYQGNIVAGRTQLFVVESSLVLLAWYTHLSKDFFRSTTMIGVRYHESPKGELGDGERASITPGPGTNNNKFCGQFRLRPSS